MMEKNGELGYNTNNRNIWTVEGPWLAEASLSVQKWMEIMNQKLYEFESLIYDAENTGGAYIIFPYDIRAEFGRGRVKVHATFDGEPYDGSIVNMGVKDSEGNICYIIGIRKDIRARIGKQPGSNVFVTVKERE